MNPFESFTFYTNPFAMYTFRGVPVPVPVPVTVGGGGAGGGPEKGLVSWEEWQKYTQPEKVKPDLRSLYKELAKKGKRVRELLRMLRRQRRHSRRRRRLEEEVRRLQGEIEALKRQPQPVPNPPLATLPIPAKPVPELGTLAPVPAPGIERGWIMVGSGLGIKLAASLLLDKKGDVRVLCDRVADAVIVFGVANLLKKWLKR
jgi:hypothetical protein